MDRLASALAVLAAGLLLASCGDPVMVVGDWPGTLRIVAGVPDEIGPTADSIAVRARLYEPRGAAVDDAGTLYVADHRASRILAVTSAGRLSVLSEARCGLRVVCLSRPDGVALDGRGGLIVADPAGHAVLRLDLTTRALTRIAGTGRRGGSPDGVAAAQAPLVGPTGAAVDAEGRVYFTEPDSNRVRVIGTDGRLGTLAGRATGGFGGDGGPAGAARLSGPTGLAVAAGVLYIADTGNHRVRAVDLASGTIRTVAGVGAPNFGGDGGPATQARLRYPRAVAATADGQILFVADSDNARIRAVHLVTGTIATFAGNGDPRFTGDGGSAGATGLDRPSGLAVFRSDLVFIVDTGHQIVWRGPVRF